MKYTASENATRKQVFEYIRKNCEYCTQREVMNKFGSGEIVKAAIKEANTRIQHSYVESFRDRTKNNINKKAESLVACLPSSGYSMGEWKAIKNKAIGLYVEFNNTKEYSGSCKWRPTYGLVILTLPVYMLAKLEALDGMMTLRGKQIQNGIWKCQWVEFDYTRNGRGIINSKIKYHMVNGYVVRREQWDYYTEQGGWYHTTDIAEARKRIKKFNADHKDYLKREAIRIKNEKAYDLRMAKEAKAEARRKAKEAKELDKQVKRLLKGCEEIKDALQHGYVYADSIKAGNCVPGTNGFIAAHNLHKDDTRTGEFLLRISKGTFQHTNVIRILVNYIKNTYNDFFINNEKAINIVLKNI